MSSPGNQQMNGEKTLTTFFLLIFSNLKIKRPKLTQNWLKQLLEEKILSLQNQVQGKIMLDLDTKQKPSLQKTIRGIKNQLLYQYPILLTFHLDNHHIIIMNKCYTLAKLNTILNLFLKPKNGTRNQSKQLQKFVGSYTAKSYKYKV